MRPYGECAKTPTVTECLLSALSADTGLVLADQINRLSYSVTGCRELITVSQIDGDPIVSHRARQTLFDSESHLTRLWTGDL